MTGSAVYILLKKETADISTRIDNLPKAFVPQGSIAFANLPEQPAEDKLGFIWNITDNFTTDSRFIEGAGKQYPAGNNVACIKHNNAYYYDVMSVIDLSKYYTKVEVNDLLQAEASDRTNADNTLQTNINNEATIRESADNVLTTDLQIEVERATQEEAVIQGNLNNEITTRTNADLGLHNEITTEALTRETAINDVNNAITQEATTREQADLTLNTNLNSEVIRATSAESTIATNLDSEVTRANLAESTISGNLDTEVINRTNADTTLQNNITAEETARIAADNTKVDKQVVGTNGTAYIFNESDGGGAKFENNSGIESFVGVHDGGSTSDGLVAQIYADKYVSGKWQGAKLDVTNNGMYYTVGDKSFAERAVAENEIATKGNIANEAALRVNADTALQSNIDTEASARAVADATLETNKLNKLPNVDDPTDPGYGFPYWIPYSFATTTKIDGLDITLKTLTLDNQLLKHEFTNPFPVVSSTQAGIMTAADKVSLDGKQDILTAGTNIQIANNVISATDTKYTVTVDI